MAADFAGYPRTCAVSRQNLEVVHPSFETPVALKDRDDDPVVYTAIDGKADVLCTLDRDFYEPEVVAFCRKRGVSILDDVELLQKLKRI